VTVLEAVAAFAADGKGTLSPLQIAKLLLRKRIPGYIDKYTGQLVVTEARILPKKKKETP